MIPNFSPTARHFALMSQTAPLTVFKYLSTSVKGILGDNDTKVADCKSCTPFSGEGVDVTDSLSDSTDTSYIDHWQLAVGFVYITNNTQYLLSFS